MRIKGHHPGPTAFTLRRLHRPPDHSPVPEMDSVEDPEGEVHGFLDCRQFVECGETKHVDSVNGKL
jgi:hypothetical protein